MPLHHLIKCASGWDSGPRQEVSVSAHIDFAALMTRQQAAWSSGDYSVIGATLQIRDASLTP